MQQQSERSSSESYFWPTIWAVSLHALMFGMLFVSFAFTPELPPSRPIVQATLYQLKSQSQATTQTNQKIAGEKKQTTAPQYETEQLEQKKAEEQKVAAAAKAAEQKKAEEARKADEAVKKAEEAKQVAEAKKAEEAKKVEEKKQADFAKKKAEEEAKKKAAEEAKKKAAEEAKKKAAEEAKKKATAEAAKKKAAEEAKKKAAADAARKKSADEAKRKAAEDKKAAALAELLSEDVGHQQALADEVGDQVAGSLDDLIIKLVSEQWRRPPSARNGMSVEVLIEMLPDGTITNASVTRSSGDAPFDSSAVSAVRSVGRIPEMQQLDRATFDQMYRQRRIIFKPEDLGL
ncbi:cell envelope integrity protein TolA [Pseudomonas sp. BN515]|uniref:cell envelope integrity protein TolA n=1 Tax=Pseudomonas sp. BN515 TaxID=2567892 RepID=UPI002456FA39|nr:cell envelope integrity protein TolA [Pseudomonas sp. BN515]MDH4872950.1 cell envelope integrity protein TolA [Pseudomonas sp. BN515]